MPGVLQGAMSAIRVVHEMTHHEPRPPAGYIKNRKTLLSAGNVELRRLALDIAEAAISCADPGLAVRRHVSLDGDVLQVGERTFDLKSGQRIFVVGAGKATFSIAKALDQILGGRIYRGLITCKYGQHGQLDHIGIHHASHPVPDRASLDAATRTVELVRDVRPNDIVIACFTGGSSALFVSPAEGIRLEDKAAINQVLLTCGANIIEINAVRKHLSKVKGGKLARMLPAGVNLINLTVSDVIGDHLDYITDPTVADTSTFGNAQATLDKYELWSRLPNSVTSFLCNAPAADETVRPDGLAHLTRTDIVLVKTDAACAGAAETARRLNLTPLLLSTCFEGESSVLGRNLVAIAKQILINGNPIAHPCVLIGGGETTVTVKGRAGQGGPNQEFAVGAALDLADVQGVVALGLDTDGTDGPSEYAGALVDGSTFSIARAAGVDLYGALRDHNVSPALTSTGHALITGATGTNVNDLKLVVVAPLVHP
jgi:glycerate-2-kinase